MPLTSRPHRRDPFPPFRQCTISRNTALYNNRDRHQHHLLRPAYVIDLDREITTVILRSKDRKILRNVPMPCFYTWLLEQRFYRCTIRKKVRKTRVRSGHDRAFISTDTHRCIGGKTNWERGEMISSLRSLEQMCGIKAEETRDSLVSTAFIRFNPLRRSNLGEQISANSGTRHDRPIFTKFIGRKSARA